MTIAHLQDLLITAPAILVALTVHEYAHGWVAWRCGDDTARRAGRLTLNPFAHLDPFGALMLFFGPFGWAKPVPVNPRNFRNPKPNMLLVSVAGPGSNVISAIVFGLTLRYLSGLDIAVESPIFAYLVAFLQILVSINIGLSFFNLLPFPPLDGSNMLLSILPASQIQGYLRFTRKVPMIFLILILIEWGLHIPTISLILGPLYEPYRNFWMHLIFGSIPF